MIRDNMIVTIVTDSFLNYARTLRAGVAECNDTIGFLAVVIDAPEDRSLPEWAVRPSVLGEEQPRTRQLMARYDIAEHGDFLRWSLKSQLLLYCIRMGAQKVLWADPDVMFFQDPASLFDLIEPETVLLSPHYRAFRPSTNEEDFRKNFTEGIFQAGFLGVGRDTVEVLDWWAEACLWEMSTNPANGTYVDQKFLDLLPVYWTGTKILRHRGCNIGDWNWHESRRSQDDEHILINGQDPIIFIHFTDGLNWSILRGRDANLLPYLERYIEQMKRFDAAFQIRTPHPPASAEDSGGQGILPRAARLFRSLRNIFRRNSE